MIEYLDENFNLHVIDGENHAVPESWILIPEGADILVKSKNGLIFYKNTHDNEFSYCYLGGQAWVKTSTKPYSEIGYFIESILWRRKKGKKMKEWLLKTEDGKYHFHRDDMDVCPKYIEKIEIPEGATHLLYSEINNKLKHFANNENKLMALYDIENGCGHWYGDAAWYMYRIKADILWQRKDDSIIDKMVDNGLTDNTEAVQKIFKPSDFGVSELPESKHGVEATLAERQSQYGCFEDVAFATENIIGILKRCGYDNMPNPHKMAMYMIVSKMARAVNGDCNYKDNWHDIGGYAKLIENLIDGD